MEHKYYENFYLDKIIKDLNIDPYTNIVKLEEYFEMFPQDYVAYTYYLKALVDVGRFEDALKVANALELSDMKDKLDIHFWFPKFRALVFTENYEEANKIYVAHKDDLGSKDKRAIVFEAIYAKLHGEKTDIDIPTSNLYFYNQYVNYSEEEFFNHVKKHLIDWNEEVDMQSTTVFNSNFPIARVVEEVKKYIPSDKRLYYSFFNNIYVFKYEFNGKSDGRNADYFKVITAHDTDHIITMYPYVYGDLVPYIDLNYLNEERHHKVRTRSQIDKFNQKYNK